ncbi:SEFIR domain-containing protein [Staphylococcus saprophyticus]|uniref:SEFIR domain-containing protein n=1 Tax=Staphylococcus saprophyticus TaxID=29385 RepID=UPI002DBC64E3|nr:SEFIR domain-containing protein [Staphylococcus saprophyticus]MEB7998534.1 TIR domain-containing protein [Staphylococcus saprophyticus]
MKKIFISYAWDEIEDEKVIKLAEMLEDYKEFEVSFDKWDINKGQEVPLFMERGIQQSDFVLIICSERYKVNADKRRGGSGYEARLMSDEVLRNEDKDRFLPIILNEKDKKNIPNFLKSKLWTELYHDEQSIEYNNQLDDLLTTIIGHDKKPKSKSKSVYDRLDNTSISNIIRSDIKILGIKQEEVTLPKLDGTRGSALYSIPFLLNQIPNQEWCEIFIHKWNNPRVYSTMHRFGKAKVVGNRIILDGTTIDEVKKYHRDTLVMCVDDANEEYKKIEERKLELEQIEKNQKNQFKKAINKKIQDIEF